ncbi:mechanosensitive ion channel family protein [Candidatus Peribacteria bacterium]|nr:mechanosensitive ion channel family protein [Candidatus Peribacteria bacterium]
MELLNFVAYAQEDSPSTTDTVGNFFLDFFASTKLFLVALLIFLLSILIARIVQQSLLRRLNDRIGSHGNAELSLLISRSIFAGIITLGIAVSFGIMGVDLLTLLGLMGLGIGFAFKDLLANFIAGVVILMQKKFTLGDLVEIGGVRGYVVQIESRTTQIRTLLGTDMIVPNAKMINETVENLTANSFRAIQVMVGVHYSTPLEKATQVIMNACREIPELVKEPAPKAYVREFSGSSIVLDVRCWIRSTDFWLPIRSRIIQTIKRAFDENGIVIPYPISTLSLDPYDSNLGTALSTFTQHATSAPTAEEAAHGVQHYPPLNVMPPVAVPEKPVLDAAPQQA